MGLLKRSSANTDKKEKPTSDWPAANELLWVRLPCCETAIHPSRVEGIIDGHLVLARPSKPHLEPVPTPGDDRVFVVGWRGGAGSKQVRVQMVEQRDAPVPTWIVRAAGPIEVIQRRRYVRAMWDVEVKLYVDGIDDIITGRIIDISEGGIRCVIPERPEPRSEVHVSFVLDDEPILVEVKVAWWGGVSGETNEIGLQLVPSDPALADRLRAHAFALQLEERRKSIE